MSHSRTDSSSLQWKKNELVASQDGVARGGSCILQRTLEGGCRTGERLCSEEAKPRRRTGTLFERLLGWYHSSPQE